jgi:hypothetical protein
MARRPKKVSAADIVPPREVPASEYIKFDQLLDRAEDRVAGEQEHVTATKDAAKAAGIRLDAFMSVRKLKALKETDPHSIRAWFKTFDEGIVALGIRDQLDLEDAIDAAKRETAREHALKAATKDLSEAAARVKLPGRGGKVAGRGHKPTPPTVN